jgi:hypothetical protein
LKKSRETVVATFYNNWFLLFQKKNPTYPTHAPTWIHHKLAIEPSASTIDPPFHPPILLATSKLPQFEQKEAS